MSALEYVLCAVGVVVGLAALFLSARSPDLR